MVGGRQYVFNQLLQWNTKVLTFALKDGKEITGFFNRRKSWKPYRYSLYNPEGKEVIHIFKHAIDDIWEAEE